VTAASIAAFDELFALNVKALLAGAKAAIPPLRTTRGSIVMTASNASLHPGGGGPLYTRGPSTPSSAWFVSLPTNWHPTSG